MTPELTDPFPHKALIHGKPGAVEVAVLEAGDRLMLLLTELLHVVRYKVDFAACKEDAYVLVRDALPCAEKP